MLCSPKKAKCGGYHPDLPQRSQASDLMEFVSDVVNLMFCLTILVLVQEA